MKKENLDNRKKVFIVSIVGSIFTILALVGLTYGYYTSTISGSPKTITGGTLDCLSLTIAPGSALSGTNIYPGWSSNSTFTVKNNCNATQYYDLKWVTYSISKIANANLLYHICRNAASTSAPTTCVDNDSKLVNPKSNGAFVYTWPTSAVTLLSNASIAANKTDYYYIVVNYRDNGNQTTEMGGSFNGSIGISSSKHYTQSDH